MIKEHAELIAQKQKERRVDLGRIVSYPEYYVLKEEMEKMIARLKDNDELDFESRIPIEVQVVAARLSKQTLERFLSDMNTYSVKAQDDRDATYA